MDIEGMNWDEVSVGLSAIINPRDILLTLVNILGTDPVFFPPPLWLGNPESCFLPLFTTRAGSKILGFDCLIDVKFLVWGRNLTFWGRK